MIKKGLIDGPFYWNILFGNIAGLQANLNSISAAITEIPEDHFLALAGLGQDQLKVNALAISFGYGVRIGLEDNLWFDNQKTTHATNLTLLNRIHEIIGIHGEEFYKPETFGKLGFYNSKP